MDSLSLSLLSLSSRYLLLNLTSLWDPTDAHMQVTSYTLARRMEAEVVNGPTPTPQMIPFTWANWPDKK